MVGCGLDRSVGFFLPDFSTPVANSQKQIGLFAVLGYGEDGSVVCFTVFAEDHVGVEFGAWGGLLATLHLGFFEGEQDALFGPDHHAVGAVRGDFEARGVQ